MLQEDRCQRYIGKKCTRRETRVFQYIECLMIGKVPTVKTVGCSGSN